MSLSRRAILALFTTAQIFTAFSANAQTFADAKVQAPELAPPQRGSVAGQLANVAFGAGDLSRGAFTLPSPFALPADRAPLLASPFPTYSPEAGLSEWGAGWRANLRITRGRWLGDIDYATDDLDSPWGRLVRGTDGYYYPLGLSSPVRVEQVGETLIGYAPDGNRWTFGGDAQIATPSGTYAWYLTSVATPTGQTTTFTYDKNASGQLFVHTVRAAGVAPQAWVQAELTYDTLATPLIDERSGSALALDRRVHTVVVSAPDALTGVVAGRWHYALTYLQDGVGPGYYLQSVAQTFASGESPPPTTYAYALSSDHLASEAVRRAPKLDALAKSFLSDVIQPYRSTAVDSDDDGRPDLEWGVDNRLFVQGDDGFTSQPLTTAGPKVSSFCRHTPTISNAPRTVARLRSDESIFRVLNLRAGPAATVATICSREGDPISSETLTGVWTLGPLTKLVDVNRDRQPDLVRVSYGVVEILPNLSSAAGYAFGPMVHTALTPAFSANAAWVQDMNGDGVPDLIARSAAEVVVWRGKGKLTFETQGETFRFFNGQTQVPDLTPYEMTWVDANKDGLTDVLLSQGAAGYLFANTGKAFEQIKVPALKKVPTGSGRLAAIDLTGSGNTEIVYLFQQQGYAIALDAAGTGLLASADDGRGTVLRFTYDRAPAGSGIRYRPSVLQRLEVASTGYDTTLYEYGYAQPTLHSAAQSLLGFGRVTRRAPLATDTMSYLNEDRYSGVLLSAVSHDDLAPAVEKVEYRAYADTTSFGVAWKRLATKGQGWASTDPLHPTVALNESEITAYDAEVCPKVVRETTPHGTLQTEHQRAELASFAKHLMCADAGTTETGTHADAALNFQHTLQVSRNNAGQVTHTQLVGALETLVQQDLTYAASGQVATTTSPGRGLATFEYDPSTGILFRITGADGVVSEITDRDPRTDATRALRVDRGGATFVQSARYDGQERRTRSWNNLGGASETTPNESLTYRYATGSLPALVQVATLLNAHDGTVAHSAEISSARGEALATLHQLPEGWAFAAITRRDVATRSVISLTGATSTADINTLDLNALYAAASVTQSAQGSLFGVPVKVSTMLHSDVERDVSTALTLDTELTRTDVENGQLVTSAALDPSQRVTRVRDEAGHETHYTYDALGRIRRTRLADGSMHAVDYDDLGRPRRVDRDAVASIAYTYAPVTGLLESRSFLAPAGAPHAGMPLRKVSYGYDAIGRVAHENYVDVASGQTQSFAYFYDGVTPGSSQVVGERGLLTAVAGDRYVKTMRHRADGAETQRSTQIASWRTIEATTSYGDAGVQEHAVVIRDGAGAELARDTETLVRDSYGRVAGTKRNGASFASYAYDVNGMPLWASYGGPYGHGEIVTLTYDPLTRRQVGMNQHNASWSAAVSQRRNTRGLVDAESLTIGSFATKRTFAYAPQGFLAQASDSTAAYAYDYDATGLPTHIQSTIAGTIDNRALVRTANVLQAGAHHHTFDELGRVIQRDDVDLTYGPNGQVASAHHAGAVWEYLYDESGQRIAKLVVGTPVAAYLDDGSYLDSDARTAPVRFAGSVIGLLREPTKPSLPPTFSLTLTDARGSVLADADGTPRLPSPYGDRVQRPEVAAAIDYATKGYDADLGVIRMGVRDYDPTLNRFLTPDPLFLEDVAKSVTSPLEASLYGYAKGNPLLYTDASGLCAEEPCVDPAPLYHVGNALSGAGDEAVRLAAGETSWLAKGALYAAAPLAYVGGAVTDALADVLNAPADMAQAGQNATLGNYGAAALGAGKALMSAAMAVPVVGEAEAGLVLAEGAAASTIDTAMVRFSQDSVKGVFQNGANLNEAIEALRAGGTQAATQFPPIRLFERDGILFTLDNRRLLVFSQAGLQVPYRMATAAEVSAQTTGRFSKFTTSAIQSWGTFITIRGGL